MPQQLSFLIDDCSTLLNASPARLYLIPWPPPLPLQLRILGPETEVTCSRPHSKQWNGDPTQFCLPPETAAWGHPRIVSLPLPLASILQMLGVPLSLASETSSNTPAFPESVPRGDELVTHSLPFMLPVSALLQTQPFL